jgi:hypothetical protein
MLRELQFEVFRSSAHTSQHIEGNLKFAIAQAADRDGWRSSQPLQDAEIAFGHGALYAA